MTSVNENQIAEWNAASGEKWVRHQARMDELFAEYSKRVVAAAAALVGSWFLLRSGIHVDTFPPFLAAAGPASVTRYSGPWITAAAAAALAAGLLLLLGAVDLVRYRRSTRPSV